MATTELVRQEPSAMDLLQSAISQGASIDTIERLAKLQREMVEYQAMVEFNEAMQRAQEKMKRIGADSNNPQTKSRYASYGKLDSVLRPIYSGEGFALSFNTSESHAADCVRVLCDVTRGGYSKLYQIDMPADGKGAKGGDVMTKTHATGAAASYGMRYLLKMIFNVAIGEDDNDGNDVYDKKLPDHEVVGYLDNIEASQNYEQLKRHFASAYRHAQSIGDKKSMADFIAAKENRKEAIDEGR